MLKNNNKQDVSSTGWQKPNPSTAYKPAMVGALIKSIAEQKRITPMELEKRMGMTHRNVYRLFKSRSTAMPLLFKASEALGENLLLHYHPNVPALPDLKEAQIKQLQQENEELKQRINELTLLVDENKVLKGQLDILREVMKGK